MSKTRTRPRRPSGRALRASLRRRILSFYRRCNAGDREGCFRYLDPRLRDSARVEPVTYQNSLRDFLEHYGEITAWYTRISLHPGAGKNRGDARPFAYVYVVWLDADKRFHVFREHWVYDSGRW